MWDIDRWQEIVITLSRHKLRTGLTAFGVFWGIFMLVLLLGAGNGLKEGAISNFGSNTNSVYIWTGRPTQFAYQGFAKGRRVGLNIDDRDYLRTHLQGVDAVLEVNDLGGWQSAQYIVYKNNSGAFETRGTHPEISEINGYVPVKGRYINAFDYEQKRKVAVIGWQVYRELFAEDEDPVGKSLNIGGLSFKVIGVFKPKGGGQNAERDSSRILIPNSTLRHAFNQLRWIGSLRIKPSSGVSAEQVEIDAITLLKEKNHVHPDETAAFGSYNTEKDYLKVVALFDGLEAFSWFVAIGTLIAGVIGVGNIMLIVVKERTREIGLRKALGATRFSVLGLIVHEALVITVISGYLGLAAGVYVIELLADFVVSNKVPGFGPPSIDFSSALSALIVLVIAGLCAALLPARKAAAISPIAALQEE